MKKLFLSATALGLMLFSMSCNNEGKGGLSAAAQKNLDAQHGIIKCFDTKDFSKLGDFMAEDFVDHGGEKGDIKGLTNAKAEYEKMMATIESGKTETIMEMANDDYAISWLHFTGTLKADNSSMGMKAGDKYDMKTIELGKFKDGKAVEHWVFMEPAEVMKMMGSMTPPPATMSDSLKSK